jgi:hypothetical protein
MYGNTPFVYINGDSYSIDEFISGELDDEWEYLLTLVPNGTWIGPFAEMNTKGESYRGTKEQARLAYEHLDALDNNRHRICGAFVHNDWLDSRPYMEEVSGSVDGWCPSTYQHDRLPDVAAYTRQVAAFDSKPTILAQTGTVQADKEGWLAALREELYGVVTHIIYFNQHQYAFQDGWPY